ncbi:MAG TPA: hypothetical protein DHV26_04285 [Cytophagales bacterium]|nr:hypothetical protein [Cytophagales bacterium]
MKVRLLFSQSCIVALLGLVGCTENEPGPEGLMSLFKITQEPIGTNCRSGGFKIETGIDKNRNQLLDADEIQNSVFICNGANGSNGSDGDDGEDGFVSLIKVTPEPVGPNCSTAGNRVDTGIDDNRNGELDAIEIDNTFYICNGLNINYGKHTLVLSGTLTNEEAAEIIARDLGTATQEVKIAGCSNLTTLDLSLLKSAIKIEIFSNPKLETINLNGLVSIIGTIRIENLPQLESLQLESLENFIIDDYEYTPIIKDINVDELTFPKLKKLENFLSYEPLIINGDSWTSLSFPELTEGRLEISGANLSLIALPKFATGGFVIQESAAITTISLPEFLNGDFYSGSTPLLETVNLPKFTNGSYLIFDAPVLNLHLPEFVNGTITLDNAAASLSLPKFSTGSFSALRTVFTEITLLEFSTGVVYISYNSELTTINLPKLVPSQVIISSNPKLSAINFPTFESIGDNFSLEISNCNLSSAAINTLLANLAQINPPITERTINLSGMTPAAPPTGEGITNKDILITNGNNVITD